ncbi:MAG: hypothetical protein PHX20_03310 [Candidatus Omnitrophica bacterium]|nr:hypothetical protein [Candidatus Omnitrophota bacterium]
MDSQREDNNIRRFIWIFACIAFFLSVSGCAMVGSKITEDTIIKIYTNEKVRPKDHPLIFIPGMFGTVLEDGNTGKVIWGKISQGLIKELDN